MLSFLTSSIDRWSARNVITIACALCLLGTAVRSDAGDRGPTVRYIGRLDSVIVLRLMKQVRLVAFERDRDGPIVLQGKSIDRLTDKQEREIKATYRAGYTVVLLDATAQHVAGLHKIVGEGVTHRSKNAATSLAYALRRVNKVPTVTLLTIVAASQLRAPNGDADLTGRLNAERALDSAAQRVVLELSRAPRLDSPGSPRDPNQPVAWQDNPLATYTFAIHAPQGIYNTLINVYALHRCLDGTDHYVVTSEADWTATYAQWQGATSEGPNPSMYLQNGNLVINWQDNRTYCSSPGFFGNFDDVCRYINYPLWYALTMVPPAEGSVVQINAAPAATQGQATTYTSGFSFTVGGTVNVSANGPGGGISAGATWFNTTQTTVPPLIVGVSDTGNEGVNWNFKYCTTGLEPDPGTNCTSHVQMVKDVCQAQLGDDSGTNPQQGQTPSGKFSNAVQSVHWQADASTRVGLTSFDIEVEFVAQTANTIAHLGNGGPDPVWGCNSAGCACVSETQADPVSMSRTFQVPFPSTTCK